MADDWDDDDFGTFESADVKNYVEGTTTSANVVTPSWILAAQSVAPTSNKGDL